jgi:hypothetical protein
MIHPLGGGGGVSSVSSTFSYLTSSLRINKSKITSNMKQKLQSQQHVHDGDLMHYLLEHEEWTDITFHKI